MRRLFVIIPAILLVASLFVMLARVPQTNTKEYMLRKIISQCDSLLAQQTQLRERVQILEKHLDATGE